MEDKEKIKSKFEKLYQEIEECITSLIRARIGGGKSIPKDENADGGDTAGY